MSTTSCAHWARLFGRRNGALAVVALLAFALVGAACGGDDSASDEGDAASSTAAGATSAASEGKLKIATTVAPITSIVANIGGDRVEITGIVPEGTNSHTFEPKPSAATLLAEVDTVFVNGLKLEDPTIELADANMKDGADIVELGTACIDEEDYAYDFSFPEEEGKPNPHLWTDPRYALCYAAGARDELSRRDPDNAAYYAKNYDAFKTMVDEFDAAMRTSFETIPRRVLLTYHDAYAYFAKDYDWEVIGAIQVSDFEDPTAKEVAGLIEQVKEEKVPAIFGSEVFPSPVLEQIGKEAGVRYVDVLRDDDLPGEPGDPEHSWVGLMHFDYVTMTEALGGDATALKAFEPRNVAPDNAEYPQ